MLEEKPHSQKKGTLYIVATPIGNLEDITLRALRTLREVSFIACEDTRQTIKILNTYSIKKKLFSYFHPKEQQKIPKIIDLLIQGNDGALVSDSGTPGISDPGYPLIKEALARGIRIVPIPGPSALITALSSAGLPTHRFLFLSFPSPKKEASRKLLASLEKETATLIFYLPARKLNQFLQAILETLGNRRVVIARELTKKHEEFIRGTPRQWLSEPGWTFLKGELTLLVEGFSKKRSKT
jgi:16S rRNA (cytidine1402-2'-O)-methyltransferase